MSRRRATLFGRGHTDHHLSSPRLRFRRALAITAMTIAAPGWAHLAMGRKTLGRTALAGWVVVLSLLAFATYVVVADRERAISFLTDVGNLNGIRIGLVVVAALWLAVFIDAWRLGMRTHLRRPQFVGITVLNSAVVAAATAMAFFAVQLVDAPRQVVAEVFTETETSAPQQGRYNILLIGSDSGKGRFSLRPDSMTVLSIDSATGKSALISLPRNLQNVPFPDDSPLNEIYPFGFNCADCLLNGVHTAASDRPDLYPGSDDPGLDATIEAIEETTGLKLNYHILINMRGFEDLVDAVGGLELNVKDRIPIEGVGKPIEGYIEPGRQELDGYEALWFARSRTGSDDFTRMGRQKCVISAMVGQLSPQTVLFNAQKIAASSQELLQTDIPAEELSVFIDLALKARSQKIITVSFVPPVINTSNPDFDLIRELVDEAIAKTESSKDGLDAKGRSGEDENSPTEPDASDELSGSGLSEADIRAREANETDDLGATC